MRLNLRWNAVLSLTISLVFNATFSVSQTEVSHVVLGANVRIEAADISRILPQSLSVVAATMDPNLAQRIRWTAAKMGAIGFPVHVFGTGKSVILLPHSNPSVTGGRPVARVHIDPAIDPKEAGGQLLFLANAGVAQLESYIKQQDYHGAYHALTRVFDQHHPDERGFAVVDSLPAPDEFAETRAANSHETAARPIGFIGRNRSNVPFQLKSWDPLNIPDDGHSVVYHQNGWILERKADARQDDFQNLYIVRNTNLSSKDFSEFGQVLHEEKGQFVVLKLKSDAETQGPDEKALVGVVRRLHQFALDNRDLGFRGGLVRLLGHPVSLKRSAPAIPRIPVGQTVPAIEEAAKDIQADNIHRTVDEMAANHTRYHASEWGKAIAGTLLEKYKAIARQYGRTDIEFELVKHDNTPQNSFIVRIPGVKKKDERFILGSHIDSINQDDVTARAPGADDNASGTAVNLEIFRVMMARGWHPERTVEIHGYAAEEIGLVGSQEVAQKYKEQGINVVAMLQFDMNLYKKDPNGPDKMWFIDNESDEELIQANQALVHYSGIAADHGTLFGGDSDMSSWRAAGFRAFLITENPRAYKPTIHTDNDTTDGMVFSQAVGFARIGLANIGHYGGLENAGSVPGGVSPVMLTVSLNPRSSGN